MGRQQSFVKFNNLDALKNELIKYNQRDRSEDYTSVLTTVQVLKDISPFKNGEIALVVGGERYDQRNHINLEESTGIQNVERIVFIDNERYWKKAMSRGLELGEFLDSHFKSMDDEERTKHGIINPFQ